MENQIVIPGAFDAHVHVRQGEQLAHLVRESILGGCDTILPMPNTSPPLTTGPQVMDYSNEIRRGAYALVERFPIEIVQCMYLTDHTTPEMIEEARVCGVMAAKVYPKGGTTNSALGVTRFDCSEFLSALKMMENLDMVLCLHGELQGSDIDNPNATELIDVFEREERFLPILVGLHREFPKLRIVLEHISTAAAVETVLLLGDTVAATITAHHMRFNRTHMLGAGLRPLMYCMPLLKHHNDMKAVLAAATSGNPKFFFGSDSAPHPIDKKICSCCAAGAFTAPYVLPMLAESFDSVRKLENLPAFASLSGRKFYRLPPSLRKVTLTRTQMEVATEYAGFPTLMGGKALPWSIGHYTYTR
ncbi:MAG: dihydroorotase [Candidatus Magasanikbacteria bacterium]|nr:dihydroorotase [Candidatus Magasanikbacteria bacterium]